MARAAELDIEPMRLLVVEDEVEDQKLLAKLLERTPVAAVWYASSIMEAFELLERERPDVILADLRLPDSERLDGITRLRRASPGSALVVLSGFSEKQLVDKAAELGAYDYLVKGEVDAASLHRALRRAHALHRVTHLVG